MSFERSAALRLGAACIATVGMILSTSTHAGDDLVKAGTLSLEGWRLSVIGSAAQFKGKVNAKGATREFKLSGLGIGGIGISTSKATGIVYNLDDIEDFVGTYVQLRSGVTVGGDVLEGKTLWMENSKGVRLKMEWETEGLALNLGADGMVLLWDE